MKTSLLVAACATLLAACTDDSPEKSAAAAKAHLQKGDLKAAAIEAKTALQKNPEQGEARFLLAQALLKDGNPVAAEVEFRKARASRYPDAEVVPGLAQALLLIGKSKAVVDEFGQTRLDVPAADAKLQTTLSMAYASLGKEDQARAALEAALKADPQYSSAQLLKAWRMAGAKDIDGAMAVVEAVTVREADNAEAWLMKGNLLLYGKRAPDEALAAYRKAVEVDPRRPAGQIAVVELLLRQGKVDEAAKQLAHLKSIAPRHPRVMLIETVLAYQQKDYKRARELSQQLLQFGANSPLALQVAAATELQSGGVAQAEVLLTKALQIAPTMQTARQLLITTYLRSGQPAKALTELGVAAGKDGLPPSMYSLAGEVYLQNGDLKRAEEYFAKALQLDPSDSSRRTALAIAQLASGQSDALDELQAIAGTDSGVTADLALISASLRKKEFDKALAAIDRLEAKQPDKPLASNLRGRVHLVRKDNAAARRSFERALAIDPDFYAAVASLAALDNADGKPDDARKRFEAFIARNPKHGQALIGAAQLAAKQGRGSDEVARLLARAIDANPTDPVPRVALVDLHLRARDPKQALAAAQAGVAALPNNVDTLDALGQAQQAAGERNQAVATLGKVVALQPLAPRGLVRLADAQAANKDVAGAEASLRKALEIKADYLEAQQRLIALSVSRKNFGEAASIARKVREQRPTEAIGYVLEGEVAKAQRQPEVAIRVYRAGLERAPSFQLATRLHAALAAAGRPAEAEQFSDAWIKQHPGDVEFLAYRGEGALAKKDYAAAERAYLAALQVVPNSVVMLNNLAWALGQQHKPGAIAYAEKANQLAPNQPVFMDTLAMLLAERGDTAKAIELLRKALELQPAQHTVRLNLATVYIKSGDKPKAKVELETLAKLGNAYPGQPKVAELLKSISE